MDFKCVTPTWHEIQELAKATAGKVAAYGKPDVIVGIARGGVVPARLLCDYLYVKDLATLKVDHWGITASKDGKARLSQGLSLDLRGKSVLLVDDVTDTGDSISIAKKHVESLSPREVKTATLYKLTNSKFTPDFFALEREWTWIIFPWNRTEDLINLTGKILENGKKPGLAEVKSAFKERFGLDLEQREIADIIMQADHLNKLREKESKQGTGGGASAGVQE